MHRSNPPICSTWEKSATEVRRPELGRQVQQPLGLGDVPDDERHLADLQPAQRGQRGRGGRPAAQHDGRVGRGDAAARRTRSPAPVRRCCAPTAIRPARTASCSPHRSAPRPGRRCRPGRAPPASAASSATARGRRRRAVATNPRSSSSLDLERVVPPVQPERGVRGPVHRRRQRVRDRRTEHGATGQLSTGPCGPRTRSAASSRSACARPPYSRTRSRRCRG